MAQLDRRTFLGTMALAGTLPEAAQAAQHMTTPNMLQIKDLTKAAEIACLYHCDYGDPARFLQTLGNISNHYAAYGADPSAIQIVMVAHAGGVKFFLDNLKGTPWAKDALDPLIAEKITDKVEALSRNGLKIYLCSITFERNGIDPGKVRKAPYIAFVPSGVATVGALQAKGFGYLKVG